MIVEPSCAALGCLPRFPSDLRPVKTGADFWEAEDSPAVHSVGKGFLGLSGRCVGGCGLRKSSVAPEPRVGAIAGIAGIASEIGSSKSLSKDVGEVETVPASDAAVGSDVELLSGLDERVFSKE